MEKIKAVIILAIIGDIIGYKYEFNKNGESIVNDFFNKYKSLDQLDLSKDWIYSDDTILHMANIKSIIDTVSNSRNNNIKNYEFINLLLKYMRYEYIYANNFMNARAPGRQYLYSVKYLDKFKDKLYVDYCSNGGGNGASIRSMILAAITYKYLNNDINLLVRLAYQSSKITHNNGIGIIGGILSCVFTYYGLSNININMWGKKFLKEIMPIVRKLTIELNTKQEEILINKELKSFQDKFENYLKERNIYTQLQPKFPENYLNIKYRDEYNKKFSYDGWPGASGDDSVIIAYDCLIYCKNDFKKLIYLSALHGGDSDSTATIACALYGSVYGFNNVPSNLIKNFENYEYINSKMNELISFL